jgi:hypothetical protein
MSLRTALAVPVIVSVAVAGLAACSSSSSKSTGAASTSASTAAAGKVVAKGGSGNFCKDIATSLNGGKSIPEQALTGSPAALKSLIDKARTESANITLEAPSAIRADVETDLNAVKAFYDAVIAAGYDFSRVDPSKLTNISSPQVTAANQRISAYVSSRCGINIPTPETNP